MVEQQGVPEPMWALNKIKIVENNEPLVDLRTFCPKVTTEEKSEGNYPYLRKTVAEMLNKAADKIEAPFHLHIYSAFRSFEYQKEIWYRQYEKVKAQHPEWPENILKRTVNRYLAPIDQPAPPGHCTGAAVDVLLQKPDGSFVDLVPPLENWEPGHTWSLNVEPEVRKLRMMMVEAMLSVGFSNCRDEYWHYSWGDSGWAVRIGGITECPYGIVRPPYL
jgi:D-alanyl-D-alanine dipeptidase